VRYATLGFVVKQSDGNISQMFSHQSKLHPIAASGLEANFRSSQGRKEWNSSHGCQFVHRQPSKVYEIH
jgi:hypothetical protein